MAPARKITVLIVDDHTIVREGLKHLIKTSPDIEVVGEAENGQTALREAKRLLPNVIVLDLAMPLLNGVDTARKLCKEVPNAKILVLSTYHDDHEVHVALEAGASGYLMKETASSDLLNAIRETHKGNAYFSPQISRRLLRQTQNAFRRNSQNDPSEPSLTAREREVLELIATGHANKQTADRLGISIKTVEKHRQAVMDKLNIREAATLTRYAIARGIIPCNRPVLVKQAEPAAAPAEPVAVT